MNILLTHIYGKYHVLIGYGSLHGIQYDTNHLRYIPYEIRKMADGEINEQGSSNPESGSWNPQPLQLIICIVYAGNHMMTSSNWDIFRVTGPLCGEFTGPRWIPLTKASDAELWCFLWSLPEQTVGKHSRRWWFEVPSRPLWRHHNDECSFVVLCFVLLQYSF